jgi:anti-sigma B factor antagonist
MRIDEETSQGIVILSIRDERVDSRTGAQLKQRIADVVARGNHRIIVDFAHVTFMDSTGLGALVSALKAVGRSGELLVCGLNDSASALFRLTRMDKLFHAFAKPADAVAALVSKA